MRSERTCWSSSPIDDDFHTRRQPTVAKTTMITENITTACDWEVRSVGLGGWLSVCVGGLECSEI